MKWQFQLLGVFALMVWDMNLAWFIKTFHAFTVILLHAFLLVKHVAFKIKPKSCGFQNQTQKLWFVLELCMGKSIYKTEVSSSHVFFTAHPELISPSWDLGQPGSPCPQQMGYFWPCSYRAWIWLLGAPRQGCSGSHLPCESCSVRPLNCSA